MANGASRPALLRNAIEAFNRALEWWLSELRDSAGSLLRFAQKPPLEFSLDANAVPQPDAGGAPNRSGRGDIRLKLGGNAFLYRKIKLPQSALRNIERVVHYEFSKYFPLEAADALFTCRVIPPPKGAASIEIEIWAVGRALVDSCVTMIRRDYDFAIRKLILSDGGSRDLITWDIAREQRRAADARGRRTYRIINLAIAGLLGALAVYPVTRMDAYLEQQRSEIERLEKRARPVIELREQVMALENRFYEVADTQSGIPMQAYLWSYLTRSLADRAILDRVAFDGRTIQLSGETRSVESLLRHLEADPLITEVKVVGAVRASKDPRFEVLNLSLSLGEE